MKILILVTAALIASFPATGAGFMDGKTLLKLCEGSDREKLECESYLAAVSDTSDYLATEVPASGLKPHCVPAGTNPAALRSIFVKLLHLSFIHKELSAPLLATAGFGAAFRCNQTGRDHEASDLIGKAIR